MSAVTCALRVVANPQPTDTFQMRLMAWAVLKSQRGQPMLQVRTTRQIQKAGA